MNNFQVGFRATEDNDGEPIIVTKIRIESLDTDLYMSLDSALELTSALNAAMIQLQDMLEADQKNGELLQ